MGVAGSTPIRNTHIGFRGSYIGGKYLMGYAYSICVILLLAVIQSIYLLALILRIWLT